MKRALLGAAVALLFAAPAQAETFHVNDPTDNTSCNPLGACSLRGALAAAQANGNTQDDVINVDPGTYATQEAVLSGATRIRIVGAGASRTIWQPIGVNRQLQLTNSGSLGIEGMTLSGGQASTGTGGNALVVNSTLSLTGVRVTGGQATSGGGVYVQSSSGNAALNLTASVIDHNTATGTGSSQGGGGIFLEGATDQPSATLLNSTLAFNTAPHGGAVGGVFGSKLVARASTIARNTSTLASTFAVETGNAATATFDGSLIAGNTSVAAGAPVTIAGNCVGSLIVTDSGGNVEDANQCKLTSPNSKPSTDPKLASALDDTQQPPTLNLLAGSPAIDFAACGTRTTDQRGMARPVGANCDAGAYEYNAFPDTIVAGAAPPFTFTSTDAGSTFECSLDGGAFVPCASPYDPGAAPGTHTLAVRAVDPQGQVDGTPASVSFTVAQPATPTPTPTASPTPVAGKTVVVKETKGKVRVKPKGAKGFTELDATQGIPVGSEVDTRDGTVELTSIPKAGGKPETAVFYDGLFRVTQAKGITNLTLTEQLAACPKRGKASAAAKKPKTRKLWGAGKGAFRTSGKYSAATVRGTKWLVQDSCSGTLTRVTQGVVRVRDNVKHKTITLRAPHSYTARPKR